MITVDKHTFPVFVSIVALFVCHWIIQSMYYKQCAANLLTIFLMRESMFCQIARVITTTIENYFFTANKYY